MNEQNSANILILYKMCLNPHICLTEKNKLVGVNYNWNSLGSVKMNNNVSTLFGINEYSIAT